MIIKPFKKRDEDIAELERLAKLPGIKAATKTSIEREIRNIRAGDAAEAEVAYELDFNFAKHPENFYVVIHGLRLQIGDRVAQIDHLMINHLLETYVIESKSFSGGVAVNDHGEFTTFFNRKPIAVASPITQNERHIAVLKEAEAKGLFRVPKRLGMQLQLTYKPVVLVGKTGRITRPKAPIQGLDWLGKADQFAQLYRKEAKGRSLAMAAKMVSVDALRTVGHAIAHQHQPIAINWAAKFGIEEGAIAELATEEAAVAPQSAPVEAPKVAPDPAPSGDQKADPCCAVCGEPVDAKVAWFCRRYKNRFKGQILCREHQ